MWIIARVTALAVNCVLAVVAFELVIKAIALLGYVPSYEDTPDFYKTVGSFIGIPSVFYVVYWVYDFKYALEEKRLEIDLQPSRIEPLLTQQVDDSVPTLTRDSGSRLIQDI